MSEGFSTDVRITDVYTWIEFHEYDAPIKFGGKAVTSVTLLNVMITVQNRKGKTAVGMGSMPLGNDWAFPARGDGAVSSARSLAAMKELAVRIGAVLQGAQGSDDYAHPIDIMFDLEEQLMQAATEVSRRRRLSQPIPKLATLVTASPFSAALLDAFGKAAGIFALHALTDEFMARTLADYVGQVEIPGLPASTLRQHYLGSTIRKQPKGPMPIFHLVGALDPLNPGDDGSDSYLPLGGWMAQDGLSHVKIKLNGDDWQWDFDRIIGVDAVCSEAIVRGQPSYSLDFNEKVQDQEYLVRLLRELQQQKPQAFDRTLYVEQPTSRDLAAHPENVMHEAAQLKPVVIDEAATGVQEFVTALEQGYSGVALKTCKMHGHALLDASIANLLRLYLCVQDLTCPGLSFIHSAQLAANVRRVKAIEGNGRQYCPRASALWLPNYRKVLVVKNGKVDARKVNGPGLGTTL